MHRTTQSEVSNTQLSMWWLCMMFNECAVCCVHHYFGCTLYTAISQNLLDHFSKECGQFWNIWPWNTRSSIQNSIRGLSFSLEGGPKFEHFWSKNEIATPVSKIQISQLEWFFFFFFVFGVFSLLPRSVVQQIYDPHMSMLWNLF